MIYLDSAATTHKRPKCIIKSVLKTIKNSANPGRGGHDLSLLAGAEVFSARMALNNFFGGFGPENVVFTCSCTHALNLAIFGTVKKGGHVVTTVLEHNSVLRPLQELKNKGIIDFSLATPNKNGEITLDCIKKEIKNNTYLIITSHISNLTGQKSHIDEIGHFAKSNSILYLVDGAQSAGHTRINLKQSKIDMLAIPSHKGLMGIAGGGALIFSNRVEIKPLIFGGTGTSSISLNQPTISPEALESGTLPAPAISSMLSGVKYVEKRLSKIEKHLKMLSHYAIENLKTIKGVEVYTKNETGVVSFNVKDFASTDVAGILNDNFKICTRAGLHCAPLAHAYIGTSDRGAVRISFSYFTKLCEIKKLINAVKEIANWFLNNQRLLPLPYFYQMQFFVHFA